LQITIFSSMKYNDVSYVFFCAYIILNYVKDDRRFYLFTLPLHRLMTRCQRFILYFLCMALLTGCSFKKHQEETPWGTPLNEGRSEAGAVFSLRDIQDNGELIVLTLSGPQTYYDYHGRGMGTHYLLCERFAQQIGVGVRVELCKDTAELVRRLTNGDGDLIGCPLPKGIANLRYCADGWAVREGNNELADSIDRWYKPAMLAQAESEEKRAVSSQNVIRTVYSPMLNRKQGIISKYDVHFRRASSICRWDWRLLAAQCYQESGFDARARSWAGACGLMQIMPATATHLNLPQNQIFDPEQNIAAAARYITELSGLFRDIPSAGERQLFVLASYNGGYRHIRDAMALAKKYGRNPHRWADVSQFVLGLREAKYYTDPVVSYGYMRGNETVDYVARIQQRYISYGGVRGGSGSSSGVNAIPQRAKKKYRFKV